MNPAEHVLEASPITELLGRELAAPRFHFEVSPLDVRAFVAGWVTLAGATLIACLLPLRRAVRIDPVSVLRSE